MKKPLHFLAALALAWPALRADTLEAQWNLVADTNAPSWFPSSANTTRGGAFNPTNGNVLVVSEGLGVSANVAVRVLSAADGSELRSLSMNNIPAAGGSIFRLDMIAVDDAGVVYAANLDSRNSSVPNNRVFRIFRWETDSGTEDPTLAYEGDPSGVNVDTGASLNPQRWGDSLDIIGSGTNTIIAAGSNASSNIALFTTEDGVNFTAHFVPGVAQSAGTIGIALAERIPNFDDPGTPAVESLDVVSIFTKRSNQTLRQAFVRLDNFTVVGTPKTYAGPPLGGMAIGAHGPSKSLGMISLATGPDSARLFTWSSDYTQVTESATALTFPADFVNANAVGSVDLYQPPDNAPLRVLYLDASNIIAVYEVVPEAVAPTIASAPPAALGILDGGYASLNVAPSGTAPFTYAWTKDDEPVPNANGPTLALTGVNATTAGTYKVTITNAAGSVTSNGTVVSVLPRVNTPVMTPLWSLGGGSRPYLQPDDLHRSLAHVPELEHLIVLSRTSAAGFPTPAMVVLDALTGEPVLDGATPRVMSVDPSVINGGTFVLNIVGCADDGVVYACNMTDLTAGTTSPVFKIYRWDNDAAETVPTIAWAAPGFTVGDNLFGNNRVGDSMAVRGAGADTQILVGARNTTQFAVFTTLDGVTFQPTIFDMAFDAGVQAGAFFHVAFGAGDTIWARQAGGPLRQFSFDIANNTAALVRSIPAAAVPGAAPFGIDPANNLLATVAYADTPDNLRLYALPADPDAPELLDQEFFATDNTNVNGTGAVVFAGDKVWALDTNNGIVAHTIALPTPATPPSLSDPVLANGGTEFGFTLTGTVGVTYRVEASDTLTDGAWSTVQTVTLTTATQALTFPVPGGQLMRYWRVVTP